jgi:hypothetical protein
MCLLLVCGTHCGGVLCKRTLHLRQVLGPRALLLLFLKNTSPCYIPVVGANILLLPTDDDSFFHATTSPPFFPSLLMLPLALSISPRHLSNCPRCPLSSFAPLLQDCRLCALFLPSSSLFSVVALPF